MQKKIFFFSGILSLLMTGMVIKKPIETIQAGFIENNDHYRLTHQGVTRITEGLFHGQGQTFEIEAYPPYTAQNVWYFNAEGAETLFKNDESVLGLKTSGIGNSNATDGYKMVVEVKAKNLQRTFYLPYNILNQHNYQMFYCRDGECGWQQKRNGRILDNENSQLRIEIKGDSWGENWNQDGYYRLTIDYERNQQARLKITKHEGGYHVSNLAELTVSLRGGEYFFEQGGRSVVAEAYSADNEPGILGRQRGMNYINFGRQTFQQSDDFLQKLHLQTDDRWRNNRYGSGWTKKIGDWGCAMTSAAMIMNYWGYEKTALRPWVGEITPDWLNTALQNRHGGYVREDLVNWVEVTRIIWELHQEAKKQGIDLPKLEYQYMGEEDSLTRIRKDLAKKQPVLVKINKAGGHWLVAINNQDRDEGEKIRIAEPYYDGYKFLEEHQTRGAGVANVISFNPSYTDLSYWLVFSSSPNLEVMAVERQRKEIIRFGKSDESLGKGEEGAGEEERREFYHYYLAKPENGDWQILVENKGEETEKTEFEVALYNQEAELVYDNLERAEELKGGKVKGFEIGYDKTKTRPFNRSTEIKEVENEGGNGQSWNEGIGFEIFEKKITELREDGQISLMLYYYLQRILNGAVVAGVKETAEMRTRYKEHLEKVLDHYDVGGTKKPYGILTHISQEGLTELRAILVIIDP